MNKNFESLHQFIKGLRGDFDENAESNQSYVKGINGRLYSHNGTISYSSVKGTKKVYTNSNIVSYHGYWAFQDELIIFVKVLPALITQAGGSITYQTITQLIAQNINVEIPFGDTDVTVDLAANVETTSYEVPIVNLATDPFDFSSNVSCVENPGEEIDWSEYFNENLDFDNLQLCAINTDNQAFENNTQFLDAIISLKKDSSGNIFDYVLWCGYQNWPLDAKIQTQGVDENSRIRRIYYTDYFNVYRMVNLKDTELRYRRTNEFDTFQTAALLQPKIDIVNTNGSIKAGTVFYTYRMITENGQQSNFSPFSEAFKILVDDQSAYDYAGGDIAQVTNKSVTIKVNIPSHEKFNEIEAFAVEYQAYGAPTAIRSLGIKPSNPVVRFNHFGNEPEFENPVTISELTDKISNWRYCSDIVSSRNKMIAGGLRNNPLPTNLLRITEDFALHGWDENGDTHNCLINPKPYKYRYIDPSMTDAMYFIYQKVYEVIQVLGNYTIYIKNVLTEETFSTSFTSSSLNYRNVISEIWSWLNTIITTPDFIAAFPNLTITFVDGKILFAPTNPAVQTDMNNYVFNYSNSEVIEEINKDIRFITNVVNTNNLVYGAVSLGFNNGNGVRISFRTEEKPAMAVSVSSTMTNLLNIYAPSEKKGFMKGEIYRTGLQFFDVDGQELFTVPLGDIMIPQLGERKCGIINGTAYFEVELYVNSKVRGLTLFTEKVILYVEVRLSCELQKAVSMYQLVAVERTEDNRTILAQGISAPMERVQTFFHSNYITLPDKANDKWCLPYYGGPTYDWRGLATYDNEGPENEDNGYENAINRVVTNRAMVYFDAPEIIHGMVSAQKVRNGRIAKIAKLNTDHMPRKAIRSDGLGYPNIMGFPMIVPLVQYPTFSRKVLQDDIDFKDDYKPKWINVSVFASERPNLNDNRIPIKRAEELLDGEEMAGYKFDTNFDVSNNALTLGRQSWFYSSYARKSEKCGAESGAKSELFNSGNISIGMPTVVISADEDIFTDAFIDMAPIPISAETRLSGDNRGYDTHGLFNIEMNNQDSVYGGRTELAFSKNVYYPISETIPVLQTSNGAQNFIVYGDVYSTLVLRNKNYASTLERGKKDMNNSGGCNNGDEEEEWTRTGAWYYAFVCETMIEPRMTFKEVAWKQEKPFNIANMGEEVNEAYRQNNSTKSYIPRPFRFKDNPDMLNVVAVSDVKLSGAFLDGWTRFRVNNFYELERDKGAVFNLAKYLDNVFAIQERQESELMLDQQSMVQTDNGQFSIQQGDGSSISDHKVLSDYGTSIRRAIVDIISSTDKIKGFTFFDENKIEFVRVTTPLFLNNSLHLKYFQDFKNDPIVDTEGYYDDEYKETNIRVRTKSGLGYVISYNEVFECFNGHIEYNNKIYMVWNQEIFAPITAPNTITEPAMTYDAEIGLHQLNTGNYLNFFEEQKMLKLAVLVNEKQDTVKIFPSWSGIMNIDYPVTQIELKTSLNQLRDIFSNHPRYIIREGRHTVPLKNDYDWADLRGNWMYLEITVESIDNKKVDIFSFINFVRKSSI